MRRRSVGLILGILLVLATAPVVSATTTKIAITGTSPFSSVVQPGTTTWDGTVMQVRGMVWDYAPATNSSLVTGVDRVVINYDLDVVTGLGGLWGTDTLSPTAYPGGGFDCHWQGTWAGGMPPFWTGKAVCHGFGSLLGYQLREDIGTDPALTGVLFKPGE